VVSEFCYAHLFSLFSSVLTDIPEWQCKSHDCRLISDVFKYGFEETVWALEEGDNKAGECSPYILCCFSYVHCH
jgi:hypothetical protein